MSEYVMVKRELLERAFGINLKICVEAKAELRAVLAQEAGKCEPQCKCSSGAAIVPWLHASYCPVFRELAQASSPPAPVSVPIEIHQQLIEMRQQFERANFVALGKLLSACLDKVKEMNK